MVRIARFTVYSVHVQDISIREERERMIRRGLENMTEKTKRDFQEIMRLQTMDA